MNRPSFFIVGAANCGTAALQETLRRHPGIFLPHHEGSEVGGLEQLVSDQDYLRLFQGAPENSICGSAEASQIFSEEAPTRIQDFEANAKIVIMLRPPVTWMRSWHHDLLRYGYENKVSFGEALDAEGVRREGKELPKRNAFAGCLAYREAAHFSKQVERYYELFGRESVFVGLMEDLQDDSDSFMSKLLTFLGADVSQMPKVEGEDDSEVLRGTLHFDLAMGRLVGRLPGGEGLKKSFAKKLQPRYEKFIDGIFSPMSDKKIEPLLEEELLEEFEPEVAKLGELIGRDLSHWNEPRFPRSEHDHHH